MEEEEELIEELFNELLLLLLFKLIEILFLYWFHSIISNRIFSFHVENCVEEFKFLNEFEDEEEEEELLLLLSIINKNNCWNEWIEWIIFNEFNRIAIGFGKIEVKKLDSLNEIIKNGLNKGGDWEWEDWVNEEDETGIGEEFERKIGLEISGGAPGSDSPSSPLPVSTREFEEILGFEGDDINEFWWEFTEFIDFNNKEFNKEFSIEKKIQLNQTEPARERKKYFLKRKKNFCEKFFNELI